MTRFDGLLYQPAGLFDMSRNSGGERDPYAKAVV
jgi:hypothetical protein